MEARRFVHVNTGYSARCWAVGLALIVGVAAGMLNGSVSQTTTTTAASCTSEQTIKYDKGGKQITKEMISEMLMESEQTVCMWEILFQYIYIYTLLVNSIRLV